MAEINIPIMDGPGSPLDELQKMREKDRRDRIKRRAQDKAKIMKAEREAKKRKRTDEE